MEIETTQRSHKQYLISLYPDDPKRVEQLYNKFVNNITDWQMQIKRTESGKPTCVSKEIIKGQRNAGATERLIIIPDHVTSRQKLGEHLTSIGIVRGTAEYRKAYKLYGVNLPVH